MRVVFVPGASYNPGTFVQGAPPTSIAGDTTVGMSVLLTPEQQSTLAERIRARDASAEEEFFHLFAGRIAGPA